MIVAILFVMPIIKLSIVSPAIYVFYKMLVAFGWDWAIAPADLQVGTILFLPACFLAWCLGHILLIPIYKRLIIPCGLSAGEVPLTSWKYIRLWLAMNVLKLTAPIDDFL